MGAVMRCGISIVEAAVIDASGSRYDYSILPCVVGLLQPTHKRCREALFWREYFVIGLKAERQNCEAV